MEKSKRNVTLFIFSVMILLPQIIISCVAFEQEKQSLFGRVRDVYYLLATHSFSSWEKLKSFVKDVQRQYFPPNVDFRPRVEEKLNEGAKQRMREAAKKTFGSSKSMVEKSAKSAAGAVGNVVHKTSQKVTESGCTGYACTPDEL